MATPDPLAVLKRADQRWATKRADDPAEAAYLQHLAAAVTPLLSPPAPAPQPDNTQRRVDRAVQASKAALDEAHATIDELRIDLATAKRERVEPAELAQLRTDLEVALLDRDAARRRLGVLLEAASVNLCDDGGPDEQVQAAAARFAQHAELEQQLAETTSALDALSNARDAASDQLRALQAEQPAVAELTNLLGRLVDAITTQWQPDGDLSAQVDLAVELVTAASAQIAEWHAKAHVHQYPRDPTTGHIGKCACGKRIPKTAKAGLTTASRGVA